MVRAACIEKRFVDKARERAVGAREHAVRVRVGMRVRFTQCTTIEPASRASTVMSSLSMLRA